MMKFIRRHSRMIKAIAVVAGVLGLLALVYFAGKGRVGLPGSPTTHSKPYEYLYLDSARVDTYLGQLQGGNTGEENRSETNTTSANAGLQVSTIGNAAVSASHQLTTSAVVTLTNADRFYKLLDDLQKDNSLVTVDAGAPNLDYATRKRLVEGAMVRIEDVELHLPPYLSAYPQLRYALYTPEPEQHYSEEPYEAVFGQPPLTRFTPTADVLGHAARQQRAAFIASVGSNPRLPFTASFASKTAVIPARFASLTGDPSLLSVHVTIVGKLVYEGTQFGDGASETTYFPALLHAPEPLLRDLGVRKLLLAHIAARARRRHENRVLLVHSALFKALVRSLTYKGEIIEIIPVAMYD
jgi:hypothetical protein